MMSIALRIGCPIENGPAEEKKKKESETYTKIFFCSSYQLQLKDKLKVITLFAANPFYCAQRCCFSFCVDFFFCTPIGSGKNFWTQSSLLWIVSENRR